MATASRRPPRINVLRMRLMNQSLSRPRFTRASEVVRWLGAVQAQDWAAAKWSLGMRMKRATHADVERALDTGEIVRTHVLRPTWHLVLPGEIRWMLELTAPNVRKRMAPYNRKLKVDAPLVRKSNRAITDALRGGSHLTRAELKERLAGVGIATDVQRLAHILMEAELEALICSGPRRGKQHTYALLDERVAEAPKRTREDALAELSLRYFTAHGPAQLKDFAWWSGLSAKDARSALDMNQSRLEEATVSGRSFHYVPGGRTPPPPRALLLSIFDEYTIAYTDRSDLSEARDVEKMLAMGSAVTAVIVLDGKVAGTWKRTLARSRVTVELRPFQRLGAADEEALHAQVERLGAFLGLEARVVRAPS